MCTIIERVKLANKQYYTLEDTRKIMAISYKTMKPMWDEFVKYLNSKNINVPKYGIRSAVVREYFGIDLEQLMREYNFEVMIQNATQQKNESNA